MIEFTDEERAYLLCRIESGLDNARICIKHPPLIDAEPAVTEAKHARAIYLSIIRKVKAGDKAG